MIQQMTRRMKNPTVYGPIGPGAKKHSFYVTLFLEMQSWCGLGNADILMLSSGTFLKWTGELSLRRNFVQKNIFMDFFDRFLGKFCIILENTPTLALHIFLDITPTVFLLHTMKESLVWSSQNTHILNESDRFSMFKSCPKLRDFKVFTTFENISSSNGQHIWRNGQNNIY